MSDDVVGVEVTEVDPAAAAEAAMAAGDAAFAGAWDRADDRPADVYRESDGWDDLVAARVNGAPAASDEPPAAPAPPPVDDGAEVAEQLGVDRAAVSAWLESNPGLASLFPHQEPSTDVELAANIGAARALQQTFAEMWESASKGLNEEAADAAADEALDDAITGVYEAESPVDLWTNANEALARLGTEDPRFDEFLAEFAAADWALASQWALNVQQQAQQKVATTEHLIGELLQRQQTQQAAELEAETQKAVNEFCATHRVTADLARSMDQILEASGGQPRTPEDVEGLLTVALNAAREQSRLDFEDAEKRAILDDPWAAGWGGVNPRDLVRSEPNLAALGRPVVSDPAAEIRRQTLAEFRGSAADDWQQANDNLGRLASLIAQKPRRPAPAKGRAR